MYIFQMSTSNGKHWQTPGGQKLANEDSSPMCPTHQKQTPKLLQSSALTKVYTCFLARKAASSKVSAASYLPCRLYNAPRFFRVVVTVGLKVLSLNLFRATASPQCSFNDYKLNSFYLHTEI